MEQSASASLEAECSGIVLPVVTSVPVLAAVYAIPMGVAQLVSRAKDNMMSIFIITHNIAQFVTASQAEWPHLA